MHEEKATDAFVSAPGLVAILGGSRSGVYRLINRLKVEVLGTDPSGEPLEFWAVPELGGILFPESEWTFERRKAEAYRAKILREAREARRQRKMEDGDID